MVYGKAPRTLLFICLSEDIMLSTHTQVKFPQVPRGLHSLDRQESFQNVKGRCQAMPKVPGLVCVCVWGGCIPLMILSSQSRKSVLLRKETQGTRIDSCLPLVTTYWVTGCRLHFTATWGHLEMEECSSLGKILSSHQHCQRVMEIKHFFKNTPVYIPGSSSSILTCLFLLMHCSWCQ